MDLSGKNIILTGVRRIGKVVAKALAEKGANLAIADLLKEDVESAVVGCSNLDVKVIAYQIDFSHPEEINPLVDNILKDFGKIDGLIHMAANYSKTPIGQIKLEDFDKTMQIISASTLFLGQKVGIEMRKNNTTGKMIFLSDWSVLRSPYPESIVYNGAKASVESFTKSFAKEFAPEILVNAIAPGPILSPPDLSDEDNLEVMNRTPLKKWGGEEEIVKAVLYLLDSDFVTGIVLPVDGGRSIA